MRPGIGSALISRQPKQQTLLSLFFVCIAIVCQLAHPSAFAQTPAIQERPMKHYALLFYPTRTLTPEELNHRPAEIAAWVQQVKEMGITLDPRAFGDTAASFSATGTEFTSSNGSVPSPTLSNIVFFDAPSKDDAVKIARIHPGLHLGVIIDVREWTVPVRADATR